MLNPSSASLHTYIRANLTPIVPSRLSPFRSSRIFLRPADVEKRQAFCFYSMAKTHDLDGCFVPLAAVRGTQGTAHGQLAFPLPPPPSHPRFLSASRHPRRRWIPRVIKPRLLRPLHARPSRFASMQSNVLGHLPHHHRRGLCRVDCPVHRVRGAHHLVGRKRALDWWRLASYHTPAQKALSVHVLQCGAVVVRPDVGTEVAKKSG